MAESNESSEIVAPQDASLTKRVGPFYDVRFDRAQDSIVRVLLNDVPIFKGKTAGYAATQMCVNEYVVPGRNVLRIEISKCPFTDHAMRLTVHHNGDPKPLTEFTWALGVTPVEESKTPRVYELTFEATDTTFVPCFRRAEPVEVPCEGLAEQRDLIARVQQAAELKRTDAWVELFQLLNEESYAARHFAGEDHPSTNKASVDEFFGMQTKTRPLRIDELHFESRAEGRVVLVERIDGSAPVEAISSGPDAFGFTQVLAPDIRLTRLEGVWHLF